MKSKGEKFEYRQASPEPCPPEELRTHLVALIQELIEARARPRWRLNLIEKPKRAEDEIRGWIPFDERYCRELKGHDGWPQHIERFTGSELGVYYRPGCEPVRLRASEAASLAAETVADAILSIIPGRLVVFFNHESQVWLCKK